MEKLKTVICYITNTKKLNIKHHQIKQKKLAQNNMIKYFGIGEDPSLTKKKYWISHS